MKQINSILRTLCLTALLCMASVSASAYKVYDGSCDLSRIAEFMDTDKILVLKDRVTTNEFIVPEGYAVIIEGGLVVNTRFENRGYIYNLSAISVGVNCEVRNINTIYNAEGCILSDRIVGRIYTFNPLSPQKFAGSFPVTTTSGWNNYWGQGIACGDDFYLVGGYFENEACTKPIADLAVWKNGGARNVDLGLKIGGTGGYDNWEYYDTDQKKGFFYNGDLALEGSQSFEANDDFNLSGTFTFTRDLSPVIGKWQSWYEPFDVDLTTEVLAKMDAAQIAGILTDADGNTVVAFKKMKESETMKANTPYVIRMKDPSGSLKLEYEGGKTIYKSAENSFKFSSLFDNFEIGGIYKAAQNSSWYALSTAGAFSKLNSATLGAQRLWLTMTPRTDSPYYNPTVSSKAFIDMMVFGDEEDVTGIESLAPTLSEGKGVIYDLMGRKVTSIQKGQIYIKDGKKYVAK